MAAAHAPWARAASDDGRPLRSRFLHPRRHFVFEYYVWYGANPWRHWNQWDRSPPDDLATHYVPRLGPYDSRAPEVLEQHARWIAESGAGAISVSWWGIGSPEDQAIPLLMDVMRDHDVKVAFHLEPYAPDHGSRWHDDVLYLLKEYGERRRYDVLLLLEDEDGAIGPVFKGFRTVLPEASIECDSLGQPTPDYTADQVFARQHEALRRTLREDFHHVTFLADSLDFARAPRAGFDGVAVYDNFVEPAAYAPAARRASEAGLLFSFNVNPGFDRIERRDEPDACWGPLPFVPRGRPIDWSRGEERERAAALAESRIAESLGATLAVQMDPALANARRGFLLVYLNSFNEWHEGTAFEPMQGRGQLNGAQRQRGYHNPDRGERRYTFLKQQLAAVV
jgi:hypothetical protein